MDYKEIIYKKYTSMNSMKSIPKVLSKTLKRGPLYDFLIINFFPKNKNAKILDLGCGFGDFVWFMKKKGYIFINQFQTNIPCFGGDLKTAFFYNNNIIIEFLSHDKKSPNRKNNR